MDLPVLVSWHTTSPITMSVTMVGYGQNCPTQARTKKFRVLCNTHWSRIANQQRFDFVDFLAANTLSCRWHRLAMTTRAPNR